ncbi:MAG: hypothetical protein HYW51_02140 [Candidatus Doudnabacteria bacterium]|nr:hypothetical protein [Candidatus Doudnabacteria bacterium]
MSVIKKSVIIVLGLVVAVFVSLSVYFSQAPSETKASERFITANPVDLAQIEAFSKYRSCEGHDFRAPHLTTAEIEATPSSMKHYVKAKPEFRGTVDQVKAMAPFDGKIYKIYDEGPSDQQVWLTPHAVSPQQWQFVFFHIALRDGLKQGSAVTAGQVIGTANLKRGPDGGTDNFDLAVKFTRPLHRPAIDAPFNHATQAVLDEYRAYGIEPEDFIISEEYRSAHDCPRSDWADEGPFIYFAPGGPDDYVWLTQQ